MNSLRPANGQVVNYDPNMNGGPYVPEPQMRSLDPGQLWQTIVRRRRLFLSIAVSLFVLVAILTFLQRPQYTTTVQLIAGTANADGSANVAQNTDTGLSLLNALLLAKGMQTPDTYVDLMLQPPIAQEVAKKLGLTASTKTVLDAVKAKPVPDTAIMRLEATWTDPKTSAAIANEWSTAFVDRERTLVGQQADALLASTREQLPEAESKLAQAQDELAAYEQSVGIADLPSQTTGIVTNEETLEAKEDAAVLEGQQAQATLADVQSQLASTPPTVIGSESVAPNPVKQTAESDVARLRAQLAQARQQYTDDHPTVVALRAQLAQAEQSANAAPDQIPAGSATVPNPVYVQLQTQATQLSSQIASAAAQVQTLSQQIAAYKPTISSLPAKARRIAELERAVKASQDYLAGLQEKNRDAIIAKSTAISDITVMEPADPATAEKRPLIVLNLLIGLVFGTVLGLVAVFVAEFIDDRFRTAEDIRDRLQLPLLGTIPAFDDASIAQNEWIKPLTIESFHQLVVSIRYASNAPPRSITFTSPDRGDGKSTVVYNTAMSMGSMGQRILVIDGDLRRPTMHEKFGLVNDRGLVDILVGLAKLEDVIRPTSNPDVFVLCAGRPVPNPVALLQSEAFDRVLLDATKNFPQVLIDGPALRPIVDSALLGQKTDGVVLVVSSPKSNGRAVAAALEKLRAFGSINLLGIVLNATTPDKREFSQYYLGMGQTISLSGAAES